LSVWSLGFRVEGLELRVWALSCGVKDLVLRVKRKSIVWGSGSRVQGSGFRIEDVGLDFRFQVLG
jgi:hypothetical protein